MLDNVCRSELHWVAGGRGYYIEKLAEDTPSVAAVYGEALAAPDTWSTYMQPHSGPRPHSQGSRREDRTPTGSRTQDFELLGKDQAYSLLMQRETHVS